MRKLAAGFVESNWLLIMLNSIVLAAALLLGGSSMSTPKMMVEPQAITAPFILESKMMTSATETVLIEQYAAPYWDLSIETAWHYYRDLHLITITEVTPEEVYTVKYDGGILNIVLQDGN
jgi:hypothetical protein